ncbi:MAG: YicC family protein [Lachnospiraceae bacterium]|nr:YicC family protein [Lachnospiraceae bacterium]
MIKSMTGFGRCEVAKGGFRITVEIKSVNHRYLDLGLKMPKKFNLFETAIREQLKKDIQRGKVDVFITCEDLAEEKVSLTFNRTLAREYMDIFSDMEKEFGLPMDVTVSVLSRCPEVVTMGQSEEDEEELWQILSEALGKAAAQFVEQRLSEGARLKEDLFAKLEGMLDGVAFIEERSPETVKQYREKLESKVRELLEDNSVDEGRILTEVTIFSDKICVDEETVRLKSHIQAMKEALAAGGNVGRKLDFIAQEMNREANTILSKCSDLEISKKAIDLKTEIEKVREQIQNIE